MAQNAEDRLVMGAKHGRTVVTMGYFDDARLWVPAQSFKEAYHALCHFANSSRVQDAILKPLEVVEPVDLAGNDMAATSRLKWNDMEDRLVATSASKAAADYIVTRNVKGFTRSPVATITPTELIAHLHNQGVVHDRIDFAK